MTDRLDMLKVLAVLALLLLPNAASQAQDAASELPTEPILRIETGKHGASIKRIDTDAANRFAVTASDDKTVRIWALPEGRLMRVLRLPIDQGNLGKAFAVAISPDGTTVAVGGWTGTAGHHNIFLFDRASGELKQSLRDLPNVVLHLAYSPDGRRLAASFGRSNGIRVFDARNDYRPLPSDTQYGSDSYLAAFDPTGRLVTTSWDVRLRFAAQLHRLLQSRARTVVRSAINGSQPGNASEAGVGDRKKAGGGRGPPDHLLQPLRLLLAAAGEGLDDDGQQHHQQLAHGGRLARPVTTEFQRA
jgi:hypothetical protein